MKKFLLFLIFFLVITSQVKAFGFDNDFNTDNQYASDRIIIKLKDSVNSDEIVNISRKWKLPNASQISLPQTFIQKIPKGQVKTYLKLIKNLPNVDYVEPDFETIAFEMTNDPGIVNSQQWGLFKIKVADAGSSAWNLTHGSSSVKVAIIDTGIDQDHQDLASKIILQRNCTTSPTTDDKYGHGTHVAGIVGAVTNNNLGVAGVGYDVSLINAKALADNGGGYYSWLADCIKWSADNGAKVINMSLGGSSSSRTLQNAVNYAKNKGVVLACAAGNSGNRSRNYPAYYSDCIAVAATDSNDVKASYSTYDYRWVDVAAPGSNIYSTMPNHTNTIGLLDYGSLSGTSMATPHVAGLAGLLFSINPNYSYLQVRGYIENNADKIGGTGSYWRWGRINAYSSVNAATPQ